MQINYRSIVFTVMFLAVSLVTLANNNANSPYTRFGYGDIQDQTFSRSRGMGGVAYGLRSGVTINPANPASYSAIDSTTFLFEFGAGGLLSMFSAADANKTTFNGNLEYIALQMPVTKWMGISAGILPYSFVGYDYEFSDSALMPSVGSIDTVYNKYTQSYKGMGGVSQVYIGASFDLWDHIALGVNGYYMFGPIDHTRSLIYTQSSIGATSISKRSNLYISNFNLRFGLQYHETIGDNHDLTIGAVYEFKTALRGELTENTVGTDTVEVVSNKTFEMPSLYGFGLTYTYDDRLTFGLDATYTEFSKAKFYGETDTLQNTLKLAVGAEYMHNPRGQKYVDRMMWRLGMNYYNSYINLHNGQSHNFVVTCGLGLPLRKSKTMINFNLEYGNVAMHAASKLKEQYVKFGINVTLNETWFLKSKLR